MINKALLAELIEDGLLRGEEITESEYDLLKHSDQKEYLVFKGTRPLSGSHYYKFSSNDISSENIDTLLKIELLYRVRKIEGYVAFFFILTLISLVITIISMVS